VSVVVTVLVYVLIPAGVLAGIALVLIAPRLGTRPRYRSGQPWDFDPVWWSANPAGLAAARQYSPASELTARATVTAVGGGARGTW